MSTARQRFNDAGRRAMIDARSKIHAQADFTKDRGHILKSISDKTYRPKVSHQAALRQALVASKTNQIAALADRYRRAPHPTLLPKVHAALDQIPTFTIDDDPQFEGCRKLFVAAQQLRLSADSPALDCAAGLILRHAYLVPHEPAAELVAALPVLYPLRSKWGGDARGGAAGRFKTLAPRLRQLAPEALLSESASILSASARVGQSDRGVFTAFAASIVEFHQNTSVSDTCRAMEAASRAAPSTDELRDLLLAVAPFVTAEVAAMRAVDCCMIITAVARIGAVPDRRLMYVVTDRLLESIEDLKPRQCGEVLLSLCEASYRHPMLMRRLTNRLVIGAPHMAAGDCVEALNAATAVPVTFPSAAVDPEVVQALLERLLELGAEAMSLTDAAGVLVALGRGGIELEADALDAVGDAVLLALAARATPTARERTLVMSLVHLERLGLHRHARAPACLTAVAKEIGRRGGLPAHDPELLGSVAGAIERMLGDGAADRSALSRALAPLLE